MAEIQDFLVYTNGMKKSISDKIFFLSYLDDFESIIDFGCGNGEMLKRVIDFEKSKDINLKHAVGIDSNGNMISSAKRICPEAQFYFDDKIIVPGGVNPKTTVLNLSSVIHEIYSYSDPESIEEFWKDTFYSKFKYITIRDMMLSEYEETETFDNTIKNKFLNNVDNHQYNDFKLKNGYVDIVTNKQLLEYLLKYRYIENWEREVNEEYFPISIEKFLNMIPQDKYQIRFFRHYRLPFLVDTIKNDFGIDLISNTHVQIILESVEI